MLYVNELLDMMSNEPILVMQEDFTSLLGPTKERQHKVLKATLKYALGEYEKFEMWDQLRVIYLNNSQYEFFDIITDKDEDTYPIPEEILYLKSASTVFNNVNPWLIGSSAAEKICSDFNNSQSARLVGSYHKPILMAQYDGQALVRTISHRPFKFESTADFKFSEDSRIWGVDSQNINFYNVVLYNVLLRIKTIRESISVTTAVSFLNNIDTEINRLNGIIETYIRTNAKAMRMWRK